MFEGGFHRVRRIEPRVRVQEKACGLEGMIQRKVNYR